MTALEALILGVIQGLTEFLPVSSSGHLELGSVILGTQSEDNLLFTVVVHGATALSTVVVFRKEIMDIFQGLFTMTWNEPKSYVLKIIISMIPVGIVGVFFEEKIESLFGGNILLVGCMLIITSVLLAFTYFKKGEGGEITHAKSFVVGLAQAFAVLPGVSRSGSTISTALILNVDKSKATQFSFLMVLPPILGATLLKVKDYAEAPAQHDGISNLALLFGFAAAFIAGVLACSWMVKIVRKGKLIYFAAYCLIVGIVAVSVGI